MAKQAAKTPLSNADLTKAWEEQAQFKLFKRVTDPALGEIVLYKHNTKNYMVFAKEKRVNAKSEALENI